MKARISMITLGVLDLKRAQRFYESGLGLPLHRGLDEIAFFKLNGTWLGLYERELLAEDATVSHEGSGFAGFTLAHNVDAESEVDVVLAQAVSAGAELIKPAQRAEWGGYSGYFKDPEGFLWEVAHNPHEWIGPAD